MARSREWLARAAFEGALIAFSIVAALAVNEWKEARDRAARVHDALAAVALELQANRDGIGRNIAQTAEVVEAIAAAQKKGRIYEGPILRPMTLVAIAWESAQAGGITNDMSFPTLMSLGRAYRAQDDLLRERGALSDALLSGQLGDVRSDPVRLSGTLHDIDLHARGLDEQYRAALERLKAD